MDDCYGKELILDLHECDVSKFTRESIEQFFIGLCDLIEMERCGLHFWDYKGDQEGYDEAADHLKGISAIQFISTSNIMIHTLDVLERVYLNIFSCKEFNTYKASKFSIEWFGCQKLMTHQVIDRL